MYFTMNVDSSYFFVQALPTRLLEHSRSGEIEALCSGFHLAARLSLYDWRLESTFLRSRYLPSNRRQERRLEQGCLPRPRTRPWRCLPYTQKFGRRGRGGPFVRRRCHTGLVRADITNNQRTGIGSWSTDELVEYLKTGRNAHSGATGLMAEVVADSTSRLRDQ